MLRFINRAKKSVRKKCSMQGMYREKENQQITTIDGINRLLHTEEKSDEQKID